MAGQRNFFPLAEDGAASTLDGTAALVRSSTAGIIREYNDALNRTLIVHVIPEQKANPPGVEIHNSFYAETRSLEKNPTLIVDLKDMVDKVIELAQRHRTLVRELIISGHANGGLTPLELLQQHPWLGGLLALPLVGPPSFIELSRIASHGGFYVGTSWITMETLKNSRYADQFVRLRSVLLGSAVVVLHACDVGKDQELMEEISGLLGGITVKASTVHQYPQYPELKNGVVLCQLTCKAVAQ